MKKISHVSRTSSAGKKGGWTFLSNHTHVLLCLFQDPHVRLRDIATQVGITLRMVQNIVADLAEDGFVTIEKDGRNNVYRLHLAKRLRHPLESHRTIGEVLELVRKRGNGGRDR